MRCFNPHCVWDHPAHTLSDAELTYYAQFGTDEEIQIATDEVADRVLARRQASKRRQLSA